MTCPHCRNKFGASEPRCPHCGEANPRQEAAQGSGMFQTSTVMISAGGSDQVYRSVDEVPVALRTRLLKSTNGANSATILIADRRGRKEIAKAMRNLPASAQRRLMHSILSGSGGSGPRWLGPGRRKVVVAAVTLLALAAIGLVFGRLQP
jgi:hypothetical protein